MLKHHSGHSLYPSLSQKKNARKFPQGNPNNYTQLHTANVLFEKRNSKRINQLLSEMDLNSSYHDTRSDLNNRLSPEDIHKSIHKAREASKKPADNTDNMWTFSLTHNYGLLCLKSI